MTDPGTISIQDYFYSLPEERIVKYPLAERDASKLLIYKEGEIREDVYKNISYHIPTNSLLIFNNTKVVAARLLFQKPTGGVIERKRKINLEYYHKKSKENGVSLRTITRNGGKEVVTNILNNASCKNCGTKNDL